MLGWTGQQLLPNAPGFWLLVDLFAGGAIWFLLARIPVRWQSLTRILRWLLIPWLTLMLGVIAPQAMGLSHIAWQETLTLGLGIVLTVFVLLAAVRYTLRTTGAPPAGKEHLMPAASAPLLPFFAALFHGAEEFHWCFQRAAFLALLATTPWVIETPEYWAIWLATLVALPGVLLYRKGLVRLHALVALLGTAILFFYTQNFWLCWLLHAGIMIMAGSAYTRSELSSQTI